jgi:hypothetical protein
MPHPLTRRLDKLDPPSRPPAAPTVTIWEQAADGSDAHTCRARPGEVLTRAELDALPTGGPGFSQIVVTWTDPDT